jgi:hypothetical protein
MSNTVKGGKYVVGSNFVNANGEILGPVEEPKKIVKLEVKKPSTKSK